MQSQLRYLKYHQLLNHHRSYAHRTFTCFIVCAAANSINLANKLIAVYITCVFNSKSRMF